MLRKLKPAVHSALILSSSFLSMSSIAHCCNTQPDCCPNKVNACHVNNIKYNYPDFYDVVTENSPKSNANQDICVKGLLCVSGMTNFDLQYSDRFGSSRSPVGGSFSGVGVRPLFGLNSNEVIGNINNIDLFLDVNVTGWATGHFDLAYVNASRRVRHYAQKEADFGSVYRAAAALKVNQAYLLLAKPECTPFYFKIGRFNHPFGTYKAFDVTPSFTQLLSEIRAGGLVFGAVFENGFYGSVQYTMAQQSLESLNGFAEGGGFSSDFVIPGATYGIFVGDNKDRNYGLKLGFRSCFNDIRYHVNAAYIADIRDSDYLLEGAELYNTEYKNKQANAQYWFRNSWVIMKRAAGLSLHGDIEYCNFGFTANYVSALSDINHDANIDGKICAYDLTGRVDFPVFGYNTRLRLSYQAADHTHVHYAFVNEVDDQGPPPGFLAQMGNVLPCHRWQADYEFKFRCNMSATLQWVHDEDWDEQHGGTDRASNLVVARIHAEF